MPQPRPGGPWWRRLPMHVVNGLSVALGIGLIQTAVGAAAGAGPALIALSGAVCASLADTPLVPRRTFARVALGGLIGTVVTLVILLLHGRSAVGLGLAITAIGFVSAYLLAWGARAGALSFVGVLALVFAMASPPVADVAAAFVHAGWTLFGAAAYLLWSVAASAALQPTYRRRSVISVCESLAALVRTRVAPPPAGRLPGTDDDSALRHWLRLESVLNDRIQAARDLLFEVPSTSVETTRLTALLLIAIDLRDTVLATDLDLALIGHDADGAALHAAVAVHGRALAARLDALGDALRDDRPPEPLGLAVPLLQLPAGHPAAPLASVLTRRLQHVGDDLQRAAALLRDEALPPGTSPELLAAFVSGESWSPTLLRAQWSGRSPVLRHAARLGLAVGSAYALALWLPWASHPHWLVLSVAVVLRGTLEQTLARRNQRVVGTVLGCGLVLAVAQIPSPPLISALLLVAIGVAHAFVNVRYLLTATAATVLALLQAHLAHPAGGFAVGERLADTLLGAALAWAFCFVLPSWERRGVRRAVTRMRRALDALSTEVLRWPDGEPVLSGPQAKPARALGLARREAYDSLAAIAALAQRSRVEPESVRLPLRSLVDLLGHGQQLLAHLAAMRLMLQRRRGELVRDEAEPILVDTAARVHAALVPGARPEGRATEGAAAASTSSAGTAADDPLALPAAGDGAPLLPWFRRRARLAAASAAAVAAAASGWREPGA